MNLNIEQTSKTPEINCDQSTGKITIHGVSLAEDAINFYVPLKKWIEEYLESPQEKTEFNVNMEYFNTSTAVVLMNIYRSLKTLKNTGKEIQFNWYHYDDDDDMKELGEEYKLLVGEPFQIISLQAEE